MIVLYKKTGLKRAIDKDLDYSQPIRVVMERKKLQPIAYGLGLFALCNSRKINVDWQVTLLVAFPCVILYTYGHFGEGGSVRTCGMLEGKCVKKLRSIREDEEGSAYLHGL